MEYYQDSYRNDSPQGYGQDNRGGGGEAGGGYRGGDGQGDYNNRPPAAPPLLTEKIVTERKQFFLDLKENNRGRVLKITEDVRGRRDTIMVPIEVLQDFYEAIGRIMDYERTLNE